LLKDNGSGAPGDETFAFNHTGPVATNSFAQINVPTIPDAFTLQATDTVVIDIDPAADAADLLSIGSTGQGALTIAPGASLELNFLNDDFLGEQTFNILDFATISGSFGNNITFSGLPSNVLLDLSNLEVNGQISTQVVPEPYTVAAWLISGLAGVLGFRFVRRRAT
jgi:hypothetical protein